MAKLGALLEMPIFSPIIAEAVGTLAHVCGLSEAVVCSKERDAFGTAYQKRFFSVQKGEIRK